MDFLPKINFVYSNLHVRLPTKSEGVLNGIVKKFLWKKGHPQIARRKLEASSKEGGFGLPIFKLYQDTSILRNAAWLMGEETCNSPRWVTQEKEHTLKEGFCVYSFILGDKVPVQNVFLDTLRETRKVMKVVSLQDRQQIYLYVKASIWSNPFILYGGKQISWNHWMDQGFWSLNQLFDKSSLKSFKDLNLPGNCEKEFEKEYEMLMEAVSGVLIEKPRDYSKARMIKLLKMLEDKENARSSNLYALLYPDNIKYWCQSADDWGQELKESFGEEDWRRIMKSSTKANVSLADRLRQQKMFLRINWSPVKMFRLGLLKSDLCWKCKQERGTLSHLIVHCIIVKKWWSEVGDLMSDILQTRIVLNQRNILFSDLADFGKLEKSKLRWVSKGVAVGLKVVMKNWKTTVPLRTDDWIKNLIILMEMERVTFRLRDMEHEFECIWGFYKEWVANRF